MQVCKNATIQLFKYDYCIEKAEVRELSAALLLDLSAAFDVVDHSILLEKLKLYNFSPNSVAWFRSYLANRKQVVAVESKISDQKDVGEQGVPQGSLLGPILFIIFYNDFPDIREEGASSILYADDDTDNTSDADPDTLQLKIQREANLSTSWVHDNKLVCSGSKTKLLVIGTSELRRSKLTSKNKVLKINVAGHEVTESSSERLLGLIVNNTMTWDNHLYGNEEHKGLVSKLSQRTGLIKRLSKIMPRDRLLVFAEGMFFSLLNYCIEVYGNVWGLNSYDERNRTSRAFRKEDNRRLQILVNEVLRCVTGLDRYASSSALAMASRQLSVHQRTALFTLTSVHKTLTSKKPSNAFSKFNLESRNKEGNRIQDNCNRIQNKLSLSRCGFFNRGSRLYNQLPSSLVNIRKQEMFK